MHKNLSYLSILWLFNLALFFSYTIGFPGLSLFKSSVIEYNNITSDPFDGAVSPIAYVPDWTRAKNTNKSRVFGDFSINDFIEIPEYDISKLSDDTQKNSASILTRYTYPVVYMGSYRGNYTEYDGSHGAVDIRAPIGTPVVAIANGVVVRVKDVETGDGKYVVIRHDNIDVNGQKETLYSAYEHLSEIVAVEWDKIKRGEVLGKVGMTGITTTPHLHFQIDKASAPFHAYWPFTFREAGDLGLDFFGAINVGLGKENTIRYTIHPMEFIKNNKFFASAPPEKTLTVASDISVNQPEQAPITTSTQLVADASDTTPVTKTEPVVNSAPPVAIEQAPTFTPTTHQPFGDIPTHSPFYAATKYLADAGITKGYSDHRFHPNDLISRSETILLYARIFKLQPLDSAIWEFNDILPSDEVAPYLARALQDNILARADTFRPNDSLTRAEAITLLVRSAKLPVDTAKRTAFQDVKLSHTHRTYINTFANYLRLRGTAFSPDTSITRGELAKILFAFDQKQKKG